MCGRQQRDKPPFSRLLYEFVARSGYTQERLAEEAGLATDTLLNWLKGRVRHPRNWQDLARLADQLGLSARDFDQLLEAASHPPLARLLTAHPQEPVLSRWRDAAAQEAQDELHALPPFPPVYPTPSFIYPSHHQDTPVFVGVPLYPPILVGRERELATLRQELGIGQMEATGASRVAISAAHGMGGVGKTTLATVLAWDAAVLQHFRGGVIWAGLGLKPSLPDILNLWASGLGIEVSSFPVEERVRRVQARLSGRRFLIVLDDVWQE